MSLTSFLLDEEVRDKFATEFFYLKFAIRKTPSAPPLTKHYGTIGTAFDYLFRFFIKRLNRFAIEREWIAEHAIKLLQPHHFAYKKGHAFLEKAKNDYRAYLKAGKMTEGLFKSCLRLAQIDAYYRTSNFAFQEPPPESSFGVVDPGDIKDLKQLIELVDPKVFKSKSRCLLNPTFGNISRLIGGADADLVLDDMIMEVKTTQTLELKREYFNQLLGYYSLYRLDKIDGFPPPRRCKIKRLGIYFSRFGILCEIKVKDTIDEEGTYPKFLKWLQKRILR